MLRLRAYVRLSKGVRYQAKLYRTVGKRFLLKSLYTRYSKFKRLRLGLEHREGAYIKYYRTRNLYHKR
jgi:hypothetical protein